MRYRAIRLALSAIAASGLDRLLAPVLRGQGAILTLHRVSDEPPPLLPENAGLTITPAFLDAVLREVRRLGYDILPLGELPARLNAKRERPFVVLTFDDGYRDTRDGALPVLEAHGAPASVFICTGFAAHATPLWWLELEQVLARLDTVHLPLPGGDFTAQGSGPATLRALYWRLRQLDEAQFRAALATLYAQAGHDPLREVTRLCMGWQELAAFARHPLISLGAHSLTHPRLARLPEAEARQEMAQCREVIARETGITPDAFCYPVGDAGSAGAREAALARELGYACALTTRPGVLHAGADLHLLPRISLNGLFQRVGHVRALLSGVPFAGR